MLLRETYEVPKTKQASVKALDYLPEVKGKNLLLKAPQAANTEHGEITLKSGRKPVLWWLSGLVMESTTWAAGFGGRVMGMTTNIVNKQETVLYKINQLDKMDTPLQ